MGRVMDGARQPDMYGPRGTREEDTLFELLRNPVRWPDPHWEGA